MTGLEPRTSRIGDGRSDTAFLHVAYLFEGATVQNCMHDLRCLVCVPRFTAPWLDGRRIAENNQALQNSLIVTRGERLSSARALVCTCLLTARV
jgi:hypothetical protein